MAFQSSLKKALITSAFLFAELLTSIAHADIDCPPDHIDASVQVSSIYDGDTVRLRSGEKVRFIGINTPEIGRDGKPSEPFSRKAKSRLEALLKKHNYRLNLRYGNEQRDRYGRLLAHAYLSDNRSINAILLREGLAARVTIPPNVRDFRCYEKAESSARNKRRGIWSKNPVVDLGVRQLTSKQTGFQIIKGRTSSVRESNNTTYLDIQNKLTVRVDKKDSRYFNAGFLKSLNGKVIHLRGWITLRNKQFYMRLKHPAAVEVE